mmetsp:Transcript_31100/g.78556  ORF Transcript_31100/g.78556 Transcript_31100/m.78556 type:complete len:631 (+) Transcript_31100:110-2002(+)
MASQPTGRWPLLAVAEATQEKIRAAKVLVVGAGGIGCELLKTLVLSGFRNLKVIDLDTIDTSNLNRQFLFRKKHVGQSKAAVATAAVRAFCPEADIQPFCGNVKDPEFNLEFFSQFDVVLNGLDNLEARRHVNRLCLAAEKPLVESGTAGYLGQVSVHIPQKYECFECQPKPAPKTFPVCTIRNTPEKPIHCIVWAKELLFQRLFGRADTVTDLDEGEQGAAEGEGRPAEDAGDASAFLRGEAESADAYAERIFRRVFQEDIERVLRMEELWKSRTKPSPLVLGDILPADDARRAGGATPGSASKAIGLGNRHKVWDLAENAAVFLEAVRAFHGARRDELGAAVFDKDDDLAVDFVTAAANLRSMAYHIPPQSFFDAKGMAGNIIHAIATTNAIISGLIASEAIKLVAALPDLARTTFLLQHASNNKLLQPTLCEEPNRKCPVCSKAQLYLAIDTKATTLRQFITKVLKKHLSMAAPSVRTDAGLGYEEGDDLDEDERAFNDSLLPKMLVDLPGGGIRADTVVEVDDFAQRFEVKIIVQHKEDWDEEKDPDGYTLKGEIPSAAAEETAVAAENGARGKRPLEEAEEGGGTSKRARTASAAEEEADEAAVVVEDEDGAIVLDDDDEDVICL